MSNPIDYQSKVVSKPPSEYQHAYEQERGRWLRRRLIWYSGTSLAFGLLLSLPVLALQSDKVTASDLVTLLVSNAAAACVMILAWRCKPRAALVLRIAFLFYVLASLWTIGYTYITFTRQDAEFQRGLAVGQEIATANATQPAIESVPATEPSATVAAPANPGQPPKFKLKSSVFSNASVRSTVFHAAAYAYLAFILGLNHVIICLFIPWTIRESLRPAGIIAGSAIAMTAIHVAFGLAAWWLLVAVMCLLPFVFIPGTLVCWWRYSRFNHNFKMQFESGRYRALQHELNSARQVHESNLPTPRVSGPVRLNFLYEPMRQIGGDLLMIYPSDPKLTPQFVILFDVTGHGVAAALSVNRIVGEIERLLAENPDESVAQLARSLNRYIQLTLARHHLYVSALLFQIDLATGKLCCVNAGHPTAYHLDGKTRKTRAIESNSMLLGVVSDADFDVETFDLPFAPGDAVIGYTDGASEAADLDGRMLGLAGVREAIEGAAGQVTDPGFWPALVGDFVITHRQAPPQDDTIIFTFWRA